MRRRKKTTKINTQDFTNIASSMNTAKDPRTYTRINRKSTHHDEAIDIYRNSWLGAKVVDVKVREALREWRHFTFEDSSNIIEKLETQEKLYDIKQTFKKALTYASIFGGSAVLLNVEGAGDLAEELNINNIKLGSLKWLTVLDRRQLIPEIGLNSYNPSSPYFMKPEYYLSTEGSQTFKVHSSRLLIFKVIDLPNKELIQNDYWGESIYTTTLESIKNAESIANAISSMVLKANTMVWKLREFNTTKANHASAKVTERLSQANFMASYLNGVAIDADDEELDILNINFAGLDRVLEDSLNICASASGIPATKLLGSHIKGLNSSGQADTRNFYDDIKSYQESVIRPNLEQIDKVLMMSTFGKIIEDYDFNFNTLWQPDDKEVAEIQAIKAQRDLSYMQAGVLTADVVARQLQQDETYLSLTDEDVDKIEYFDVKELDNLINEKV